MVDQGGVAAAYYERYRLRCGDRQDRLAADAFEWAVEVVDDAVERDDSDLLDLIDSLLNVPQSDAEFIAFVGAGPLEDMLTRDTAAAWDEPIADRCRRSPAWRAAVDGVHLDDPARSRLPALMPYLRSP